MPVRDKPRTSTRRRAARRPAALRALVATAGDADSLGALRLAAELARRRGAVVMALGVATPFPPNLSTMVAMRRPASIDDDSRRLLLATIRRQLDELPGADRWVARAVTGWPADVIIESADTWKASMIMLGIGRHNRVDRLFGSETAVAVVRRARLPVLAVAPRARTLPSIALAAVDFTAASLAAAEVAANLLAPGGTLILAHACAFGGVDPRDGGLADVYRAGATAKLEDAVRTLRRRTRHRVERVMLEGEAGEALLAYAARKRCDLVSLGGHDQGLMDRILIGSVRTRVLRGARCSVLIAAPSAVG